MTKGDGIATAIVDNINRVAIKRQVKRKQADQFRYFRVAGGCGGVVEVQRAHSSDVRRSDCCWQCISCTFFCISTRIASVIVKKSLNRKITDNNNNNNIK